MIRGRERERRGGVERKDRGREGGNERERRERKRLKWLREGKRKVSGKKRAADGELMKQWIGDNGYCPLFKSR